MCASRGALGVRDGRTKGYRSVFRRPGRQKLAEAAPAPRHWPPTAPDSPRHAQPTAFSLAVVLPTLSACLLVALINSYTSLVQARQATPTRHANHASVRVQATFTRYPTFTVPAQSCPTSSLTSPPRFASSCSTHASCSPCPHRSDMWPPCPCR